ncbi:MAG: 3-phosphoshikimate 1-carboxyvinyltransferase [Gemmatimonadaceae bacterium]
MKPLIVGGELRVPGDKSISHRALLLAALSRGRSLVRSALLSADIGSTTDALRRLGVEIPALGPEMTVRGVGLRGLTPAGHALDCGNSGTTTRLLAGVLAGHPFDTVLTGDASLSRRPMGRIARPLEQMGARITLGEGGGLPMTVRGGELRSIDHVSEVASAQVKSAVLLAGLVGGVPVSVHEPAVSRDHTERMLAARGVQIVRDGTHVFLTPVDGLAALDVAVPADPSSAAFMAGFAALADGGELCLRDVCLNPTRAGFFDVLARMGAAVRMEGREAGGELVGSVMIRPAGLVATVVQPSEVPSLIDELPLVACLAARADGDTEIRGAAELRVKESDRIAAVVTNLRALGVEAEELTDGMRIRGGSAPLTGRVVTHGDHRLAMAFGVLAALPGNDVEIDDRGCVAVSYPDFWRDLARVAG